MGPSQRLGIGVIGLGVLTMWLLAGGCTGGTIFSKTEKPGPKGSVDERGSGPGPAEKIKKPRFVKPRDMAPASVWKQARIDRELKQARQMLENGQYRKIPAVTEKILSVAPDCPAALELKNAAYYELGKRLYNEKRYIESISQFVQVDPDYKDTRQILTSIRVKMEQQADRFYKQGVKYYINEKLEKAIAEWRRTLALDPDHPKAAQDIQNAAHLLEALEEIEAP